MRVAFVPRSAEIQPPFSRFVARLHCHAAWIEPGGLSYFRGRISQARRDVEQGLTLTMDHFTTLALQRRALQVLQFKLDILWAMNDAMAARYGVDAA